MNFDISILQCPVTGENLQEINADDLRVLLNESEVTLRQNINSGLINTSRTYFYPVIDDIPLLLKDYGIYLGRDESETGEYRNGINLRVFNYYQKIEFEKVKGIERYRDAKKWLDLREVSHDYITETLQRAKRHLGLKGRYLLDIASGPIGSDEYLSLSDNFETRICIDISLDALRMARENMGRGSGIYICGDIRSIPIKSGICDSVLCQHTLFHIHKKDQETSLDELYRTVKPGGKVVIVYNLFYRSLFMDVLIFPVQLYRVTRHLAGKLYASIFNPESHLYFYGHSLRWFKRWAGNDRKIDVYSWRSVNKYFLDIFIHKKFGGSKILRKLAESELKHPGFWGRVGEYPLIVITKPIPEKM